MLSSPLTMSPQESDFGALLRQLRDARGWTQEQLARESGMTVKSIGNLERGATKDPNAETVERLAAAFGVAPGDLDPRRLAADVAESAHSFAKRQVIRLLLALPDRDMEAVLEILEECSRHARKRGKPAEHARRRKL